MKAFMIYLIGVLSAYGSVEMFLMAEKSIRERRCCVLMQIGAGFAFCLWAFLDKSLANVPVFLGLIYIAADRMQTRIMNKKRLVG
ncbi:MAG: hypothetical protein V4570_07290 [Pseudomonadota bacterium]